MDIYQFSARRIDGRTQSLAEYRGEVLLIVNVASQCGFTPQYAGLEALYQRFKPRGFQVLGFPSDQFGHQEPGSEEEIASFCTVNFGVTFPMFAKIDVNGANSHPLWQFLKEQRGGILGTEAIKWNFTKFLVGRDGAVRARYAPSDEPASLVTDIELALG